MKGSVFLPEIGSSGAVAKYGSGTESIPLPTDAWSTGDQLAGETHRAVRRHRYRHRCRLLQVTVASAPEASGSRNPHAATAAWRWGARRNAVARQIRPRNAPRCWGSHIRESD